MKANIPKPPRPWERLPSSQRKAIEEYSLEMLRQQEEKDARIMLDLYTKMTVCVLHDGHEMDEDELICFLGNHKRLFQRHARMVRDGTQLDYFNKRMAEIFPTSGFPQQFFDDMLGAVEEPVFDEQATGKVDNLEYTLCGVMHSVDKWLEGDELKQDEVNRAITMREKTLRIVENAKSEVERLQEELTKAEADVRNYMKVAEYQQSLSVKRYHEIKRLKEDIERLEKTLDEYEETSGLKQAKTEFAREIFAEINAILFDDSNDSDETMAYDEQAAAYYEAELYRIIEQIKQLAQKYTEV